MVDIDGVVGRLRKLTNDAHLTASYSRRGEDGRAEEVTAYGLRAREGEEDASGANLLHSAGINLLIALRRITQHLVVLSKGWWVEDDEVEVLVDILQVLHSIACDGLVWGVVAEV